MFARPSLRFALELSCDSRIDRVLGICLLCSFSWLPASLLAQLRLWLIKFFYFLTRPKVAHLIIMDYAIDDKKRALLCRSRLLLSYIILGYYQTFHLLPKVPPSFAKASCPFFKCSRPLLFYHPDHPPPISFNSQYRDLISLCRRQGAIGDDFFMKSSMNLSC